MQQPVASVPTSAPMNPGLPLTQTPTMPPAQMHGAGGPTNTPMGGGGGGLGLQTPTQQPPQRAPMGGGLQSMPQSAAMGGPSPMGGGGGGPSNQPPVMAMANTAMGGGGGKRVFEIVIVVFIFGQRRFPLMSKKYEIMCVMP